MSRKKQPKKAVEEKSSVEEVSAKQQRFTKARNFFFAGTIYSGIIVFNLFVVSMTMFVFIPLGTAYIADVTSFATQQGGMMAMGMWFMPSIFLVFVLFYMNLTLWRSTWASARKLVRSKSVSTQTDA